jgi:histidinol-phosphate aminotransferase
MKIREGLPNLRFPVAPGILEIPPDKIGASERALMRQLNLRPLVRMDSNENCFGPSRRAVTAMKKALAGTNRYPDGTGTVLRQALAEKLKVPAAQIVLGNGSGELVDLIARTYLQPHNNSITANQTFPMYRLATLAARAICLSVPMKDYAYHLPSILNTINEETRLIYIANPNNPTGTMISNPEMDHFLAQVPQNILVVLDEAYIDYVEREDFPNGLFYISEYPNVIVLRTFSKIYGLAGIRVGYAVALEEIITNLNRMRSPFNTSLVAQAAALAALRDVAHVRKSRAGNRKELRFLARELTALGIPYVPSVTNFIFLKIPDAMVLYEGLLKEGLLVRPIPPASLPGGLRVTVGTHAENLAFLKALRKVI